MKTVTIIFIMFFLISTTFSQIIYKAAVGTVNNKLLINLKNSNSEKLESIVLRVISKPDWIEMDNEEYYIEEIIPQAEEKVEFSFNIQRIIQAIGEGKIQIEVKDRRGKVWYKTIHIETILPEKSELKQNYPNPFNPKTKIRFILARESLVKLKINNIMGETINLLKEEVLPAGEHEVEFDGAGLSSGVYFYSIEAGEFKAVRKMLLMK